MKLPELVEVPEGPFLMGSTNDPMAYDDEKPQHEVTLPGFEIGRHPVTNAEYADFVEATGYNAPGHWPSLPDHPVVNVSWHDAVAYCHWLAEQTAKPFRLPTEAEWEKAARGTDGRIYPWGDEPPDKSRCNFDMNIGATTPVGRYSPQGDSPYGCADMAGNVWEWCGTKWRESCKEPTDESIDGDALRVLRGGSFDYNERLVRCACRNWGNPDLRYRYNGFRVVVAPGPLDSDRLDPEKALRAARSALEMEIEHRRLVSEIRLELGQTITVAEADSGESAMHAMTAALEMVRGVLEGVE